MMKLAMQFGADLHLEQSVRIYFALIKHLVINLYYIDHDRVICHPWSWPVCAEARRK